MEICGRYHHWMPIVVFFMKRDLFFLWCLHFVLYDTAAQTPTALGQTVGGEVVSFDKAGWVQEVV